MSNVLTVGNLEISRGPGVVEINVLRVSKELRADFTLPATRALLSCPGEVDKLIAILEEAKRLPDGALRNAQPKKRRKAASAPVSELRYFYHPESSCLFSQPAHMDYPSDPLVEEVDEADFKRIKARLSQHEESFDDIC